jgi:hypothetical protein
MNSSLSVTGFPDYCHGRKSNAASVIDSLVRPISAWIQPRPDALGSLTRKWRSSPDEGAWKPLAPQPVGSSTLDEDSKDTTFPP